MENKWFFPEHVPVITDCPRCNFCCERLTSGVNWSAKRSRANEHCCRKCHIARCEKARLYRCGTLSIKADIGAKRLLSSQLRHKAKKQGYPVLPFETLEEFITQCIKEGCAICGGQVDIETNDRTSQNKLQIDQLIPQGGYTLDNMIGLCAPCNRQKDNHTLETSLRLTQFLARQFDIEIVAKKKARGRVVHADFQSKIKEAIAQV